MLGSKSNQTEDMIVTGSHSRWKPLHTFQLTQSEQIVSKLSTPVQRGDNFGIVIKYLHYNWIPRMNNNQIVEKGKLELSQCLVTLANVLNKFQYGDMPLQRAFWTRDCFYKYSILYIYITLPEKKASL